MKLPYSWLKELSGVDWSVEDMEDRLTRSGTAGVAERHDPAHFEHVVSGRIIKIEKHPNADKLVVADVDTGAAVHTVICGAPNCAEGQIVALALPGANLRGRFPVKEITMRGVKSAGMICAEDELGLSDDHAGIMVLPETTEVNRPIYDLLGLDDAVIDFEITPDRPDCLCAVGVAREVAVLAEKDFVVPVTVPKESGEKASDYISVAIEDADACPRYVARIIKNVTVGPSPAWMRKRLTDCGVRPINNIVDIGNYVMLEMNQPLHAFDYDAFGSKEVVVRRARADERFTTLDDQEHKLDADILMITNGRESVATAGVMGGLDSEVTAKTTTVLLESAYFDATVIRRSRTKLGLSTEASYRFERGIDPNGAAAAADRAAALMAELAGGEVLSGAVDAYPKTIEPCTVELRPSRVKRLLGLELPTTYITDVLTRLGMTVRDGETLSVSAPTYRPDITREADLIEEIARIYGMDKIPSDGRNAGPLYSPTHRRHTIKDDIRNVMTGLGFDEALGTGFANRERMKKLDPSLEPIQVVNPLSDEFGYLRSRILYSLLTATGHNIRQRNLDVRLFEIGTVYLRGETAPVEAQQFGFVITGRNSGTFWKGSADEADFYEARGILDALTDGLNIKPLTLRPAAVPGYLRQHAFEIVHGDCVAGYIGRVDPKMTRLFEIKQDCYAVELWLSELIELQADLAAFSAIPRYPASHRDIAVIVDSGVEAAQLHELIRTTGGKLIESVTVFDLFTGDPVPEGKKSLAFSLSFRSPDRTLEDDEVDHVYSEIVARLEKTFQARLRE